MASEYFPAPTIVFKIRVCKRLRSFKHSIASLFPSFKLTFFYFSICAQLFTGLHVPDIDIVVVAECLELIIHLCSEYIILTRFHFLERKQVLVEQRNNLQSTIHTLQEDNVLVLLAIDDLVIAADYSISNWSLIWSLSNVFENDL